jgi:hypothetical protein
VKVTKKDENNGATLKKRGMLISIYSIGPSVEIQYIPMKFYQIQKTHLKIIVEIIVNSKI